MAYLANLTYTMLAGKISHLLAIFGAILVAGFVYLVVILLVRIPEVMDLVNQFYHKFFEKNQDPKRVARRKRKNRY